MKLVLTGASSFIGRQLLANLQSDEHDVIPIGRNESIRWELGEPIPGFEDSDALIHLAYDRTRSISDSLRDTEKIINSFAGKVIYLSSMSAHSGSKSNYGRRKYLEECLFVSVGATVLKVGLVVDPHAEGVFGKLLKLVEKLPLTPVPLRGEPIFYVSHIDNLIDEIKQNLMSPTSGLVRASSKSQIRLKDLVAQIATELGFSRRLILVPKYPLHFAFVLLRVFSKRLHLLDSYFSMTKEIAEKEVSGFSSPLTDFLDFHPK